MWVYLLTSWGDKTNQNVNVRRNDLSTNLIDVLLRFATSDYHFGTICKSFFNNKKK
jgi:hypothetical protein